MSEEWEIELKIAGVWCWIASVKTEIEAYRFAGHLARKYNEKNIQIVTPDLKIIN